MSPERHVIRIPILFKQGAFLCRILYGRMKCTKKKKNRHVLLHGPKGRQILGFLLPVYCPASSETDIECNEVWHQCMLKDLLQRQRQKATVFYEPGLKLKSAPLPLTIIHHPRFTLTLLLCKCLYRISWSGWVREWHPTQMRKASAQLKAGSDPLTNKRKCTDYCSLLHVRTTNESVIPKIFFTVLM